MRNDKEVARHYLDTKILGAYETTEVIWQSDSVGNLKRTFADSFVYSDDTRHIIERDMDVDGKRIVVHSVFPVTATSTPTKKMLTIIGNDLCK
ncbi:hypothetical protein [Chakrabartyella piscis]|uniref:hypothetical protein n=1 Tax=Chakrabartyella piscis TaxID=2918914 RepID=UPI0029585CEE|nr:hypothetical protein [Chakrabartyella piscis]